jgi:Leucine-rich repeat (LRR) protein
MAESILDLIERADAENWSVLKIEHTDLTTLPPEIGKLKQLKALYIWHNPINELPPEISHLTNLEELNVNDNRLTTLPPEICLLKNLRSLDISGNRITRLPPGFSQLSNLENLQTFGNPLEEFSTEVLGMISLTHLNLGECNLSEVPGRIGELKNLDPIRKLAGP